MLFKFSIRSVVLSASLVFSGSALAGVEATHLSPIPLDIGAGCNSIFFRGIDEFRGTAFVVPRVSLGRGQDGIPIEILPSENDPAKYILNVYIYFPPNDELLGGSRASSRHSDTNACNLGRVIEYMNYNMPQEQTISSIAPLPLTTIEVTIPNIKSHGIIGESDGKSVDILSYSGQALAVSFLITEAERRLFESRVVTLEGIQAQVRFGFEAGSQDGSVHARVNVSNAIQRFNAAVKGQTLIAKADVAAQLQRVLDSQSVTITVEQGRSEDSLKQVVGMIVDAVMKNILTLPSEPSAGPETADNPGLARVSVKVVVDLLAKSLSQDVVYQNYSAPHSATALVSMNMKVARVTEPGLQEVHVQAGYIDPSSGLSLSQGETISIAAAYQFVDAINYPEYRSWITTYDIQVLGLGAPDIFPHLSDPSVDLDNHVINGTVMAVGHSNSWGSYLSPSFRWSRTQRYASRNHPRMERIDSTREALFSLPVDVSFSRNGESHLIHLADLVGDHEGWSGMFDDETGRLFLTAKKDLGVLQFREHMNSPNDVQYGEPVVLDQISEWTVPLLGGMRRGPQYVIKTDVDPIIKQRTIVFFVGRPTEGTMPAAAPKTVSISAPSPLPTPMPTPFPTSDALGLH